MGSPNEDATFAYALSSSVLARHLICHCRCDFDTIPEACDKMKCEMEHGKAAFGAASMLLLLLLALLGERAAVGENEEKKTRRQQQRTFSQPLLLSLLIKTNKKTGGATALEGTARGDETPPASPGPSPAAAAAGSGKEMMMEF